MSVFIINRHGEALMPCNPRKAGVLLREGEVHGRTRLRMAIHPLS
jgi:hypothetical protein